MRVPTAIKKNATKQVKDGPEKDKKNVLCSRLEVKPDKSIAYTKESSIGNAIHY